MFIRFTIVTVEHLKSLYLLSCMMGYGAFRLEKFFAWSFLHVDLNLQ
jgi:hypothetical protein